MTQNRKNHTLAAAVLVACSASVWAQDGVDLGKITVKGEGMREADRSFTINTIDQERISAERWESPLNILEEVPGFD
ncbi:MAG: hypothetical protein RBT81_06595, partial [Gammaproteobacteria bacterium]|nr:hypothetical protein [Gammaproteobacteria bacterium]